MAVPHLLEEGKSASKDAGRWAPKKVDCDVPHWLGEENKTPVYECENLKAVRDTGRCVSLLVVPRRGVDTRRCANKDAGPRRGVDLVAVLHRLKEGKSASENAGR